MMYHDNWIIEGIVVECLNKEISDGEYYRERAVVRKVEDKYVALVEFMKDMQCARIDQEELRRCPPKLGWRCIVCNGPYRGEEGFVAALDEETTVCSVRLLDAARPRTSVDVRLQYLCRASAQVDPTDPKVSHLVSREHASDSSDDSGDW